MQTALSSPKKSLRAVLVGSAVLVLAASLGTGGAAGSVSRAAPGCNRGSLNIERHRYGTAPSGATVHLYKLTNSHCMRVKIITYGGIIQSPHLIEAKRRPHIHKSCRKTGRAQSPLAVSYAAVQDEPLEV